jgi:two-component system sensor histidine kinase TctE
VKLTVVSSSNGGAIITVQDEGPGIPVDLREKVFERFYQISQGANRKHEGLGVGLFVVRVIFEGLGGTVSIVDRPSGCLVRAVLPDIRPEDAVYA